MIASHDVLERYSRRSLWTLLLLIIVIGAFAALSYFYPEASRMSIVIPVLTVIAVAVLRSSAKGADVDPSSPGMKAIINDELRQASMHRAFRNAFIAVLMLQPLLVFAPEWIAIARPAPMMAIVTIWFGMLVMVASVLFHDR